MALEPCPNCNKKISPSASECPKCGHPLTSEIWSNARRARRRNGLFTLILLVGFVGFCALLPDSESSKSDRKAEQSRRCNDDISAFVYSQQFVEKRLRSPATAEFGSITDSGVKVIGLGECRHLVIAFVDAQNGFGAIVRNWYTAVMEYRPSSDNWFNLGGTVSIQETRAAAYRDAQTLQSVFQLRKESGTGKSADSELVKSVQEGLEAKGYEVGVIDGMIGPRTIAAIKAYESENGLPVKGEPSKALLDHLSNN